MNTNPKARNGFALTAWVLLALLGFAARLLAAAASLLAVLAAEAATATDAGRRATTNHLARHRAAVTTVFVQEL